jgi:hypothetical protein
MPKVSGANMINKREILSLVVFGVVIAATITSLGGLMQLARAVSTSLEYCFQAGGREGIGIDKFRGLCSFVPGSPSASLAQCEAQRVTFMEQNPGVPTSPCHQQAVFIG